MRHNSTYNKEKIEVIVGTMYSGKTLALKERGNRAEKYAQIDIQYFSPDIDNRDNRAAVGGQKLGTGISLMGALMESGFNNGLVLMDEGQFYDASIVQAIQLAKLKGYNIVIAGLQNDYRGQPFGYMPQIMALSDVPIDYLYSVCNIEGCSDDGVLPQRLRNDKPDSALSPTIIIEGKSDNNDLIEYEPRCETHHIIPDLREYLMREATE
ncbi:hypothetical protein LCGC14_0303170 [marine sediment metagenome]|uniref:thymidine kinase n=1 Tax=marine sediment metagenome TaxID=412755 RepID=A0A0F9WBA2_9ZZZZ